MNRGHTETPPSSPAMLALRKRRGMDSTVLATPPAQAKHNTKLFQQQLPSPVTPTASSGFPVLSPARPWDAGPAGDTVSEIRSSINNNIDLVRNMSFHTPGDSAISVQHARALLSPIDPVHDPQWQTSAAPLGRGAYACVYDLRNSSQQAAFALKVPQTSRKSSHIYKEATILSRLQHARTPRTPVIPFYGLTLVNKSHHKKLRSNETVPAIVLERMNCSLKHFYTYSPDFDNAQWYLLAESLLSGLQLLKSRSVVHGDIKTENVLIDFDDEGTPRYYLADFSSARVVVAGDPRPPSLETTLEYCSPEQMSQCANSSFETDLYSVGLTLLATITKAEPYAELMAAMTHGEPGGSSSLPQTQWLMSAISKNSPLEFNVLHEELWMQWESELAFLALILQDRMPLEHCLRALHEI
ncbi:LAQU0S01e13806g1_1 [Lachancea quebecensis]|uniref:LAQU0S01e13806g1_1 n=1 Tax=Lachancea quebecensis TaxID=1654605 RepID=A0A0P1KPZ5_9SACH|nr:LAQU0S01e13806g1_1 [Lachancea quebecensis]